MKAERTFKGSKATIIITDDEGRPVGKPLGGNRAARAEAVFVYAYESRYTPGTTVTVTGCRQTLEAASGEAERALRPFVRTRGIEIASTPALWAVAIPVEEIPQGPAPADR